jgi:hypothetical protein
MRRVRREAPTAFGVAVVDLFSCAFVIVCVLAAIEKPLVFDPGPPPPPGFQALLQGGRLQIEFNLGARVVRSWDPAIPKWLMRTGESGIVAYPPSYERIESIRVFGGPGLDSKNTDALRLLVTGEACPGAATSLALLAGTGYRWEARCN